MKNTPLPHTLFTDKLSSPLGDITVSVDQEGVLYSLDWVEKPRADFFSLDRFYKTVERKQKKAPKKLRDHLQDYFDGNVGIIKQIPISLPGTQFQHTVWKALCEIPAGITWSYKDLATHIDNPKAVRAVGMANNANPIALVVPCHRVIGADGKMIGYGSGVPRKKWLLRHEGAIKEQGELGF